MSCVCVCLSVKSHLTSGASVRPENAVTYSAGDEGQKICGVFSETAPLQRSSTPSVVRPCVQSAIFPCVYAHAYFSCIYAHDTPPRVQHFSAFIAYVMDIRDYITIDHAPPTMGGATHIHIQINIGTIIVMQLRQQITEISY